MTQTHKTLLAMLDGARFANADMPWSKPGPIRLPDRLDARARLVDAHVEGGPAKVHYSPEGRELEQVRVEALALAAFTPDAAGLVHWLAFDLDAADGHGPSGLTDPVAAMRCITAAADRAGLLDGILTARSRGGRGRHIWLLLPSPVSLDDAVFGVAALTAQAYRIATADVADYGCKHAFRRPNGSVAAPGDSGAIEMFPRSTERPAIGWAIALPAAGAYRDRGAGVIIDAYADQPYELEGVPRCDATQWGRFLAESRAAHRPSRPKSRPRTVRRPGDLLRIHPRTQQFLDGQVTQGARNSGAFAAACNLLGVGVDEREVERLILSGAEACGLGEHEVRTCIASALGTFRRR